MGLKVLKPALVCLLYCESLIWGWINGKTVKEEEKEIATTVVKSRNNGVWIGFVEAFALAYPPTNLPVEREYFGEAQVPPLEPLLRMFLTSL